MDGALPQSGIRKIIENIFWLLGDRLLRLVSGVLVGTYVARYLGPESYGLLNYTVAFVSLFGPIANVGIDTVIIKYLINLSDSVCATLGTTWVLKFIGGILVVISSSLCIVIVKQDDGAVQLLVVLYSLVTLIQPFDVIDLYFQSQVNAKYTVLVKNIALTIAIILRLLCIYFQAALIAFIIALMIEALFSYIGLFLVYQYKYEGIARWRVKYPLAKELIVNNWSLILSGVAVIIYTKIDIIMLGRLSTNRSVGVFSAAARLSELWYFVPQAIVASTLPNILKTRNNDRARYYDKLQKLLTLIVALAYSVAVPMTFFSNQVVSSLYGTTYEGAGEILSIHIWSSVGVFINVAITSIMAVEGLTLFSLLTAIAGGVISMALCSILIPLYDAKGAALGTSITYMVVAFIFPCIFKDTRHIGRLGLRALIVKYKTPVC